MRKYKLIARADIKGINDDIGLWRLDGYAELLGECDAAVPVETVRNEMIDIIVKRHPKSLFDNFTLIVLDAS